MTENVYIVSAVRTPIGKFGGAYKDIPPADLGAIAIKEALARAKVDPKEVEITIMGNILRAGHGQDVARQASVKAGIPMEVDGYSVDMVCSSGMMSVMNAVQMVKSGDAEVVVAGGVESMSQSMLALKSDLRWGVKTIMPPNKVEFIDTMQMDGLTDPFNMKLMGQEADMVARSHNFTRRELDEVAYQSQRRAYEATSKGQNRAELVEVEIKGQKITSDEGIRADTSIEKLQKLKPAFGEGGFHTAGNSSQLSDGASAMVIMSERAIKERGLEPLAKVLGFSWAGIESWKFTEAPIFAVKKLLKKLNAEITDFDYFENNEAFAVNSVLANRYLGIPYDKLNVFGGAIAIGHPIGASGARIVTTLINVLSKMDGRKGIASICHGTGGSTAIAIELMKKM